MRRGQADGHLLSYAYYMPKDGQLTEFASVDAKNRLSELMHRAESGEQITISRRGKVVARLILADDTGGAQQQLALNAISALRASCKGVNLRRLRSADLIRIGRR